MNELDRIFLPLSRTMDWNMAQARAVAQNLANASTPRYRRVDVDFRPFLEIARMQDRERQLEAYSRMSPTIKEDRDAVGGPDGNSVDLDQETVLLHKVLMRHELAAQLTSGKLSGLRHAITGR